MCFVMSLGFKAAAYHSPHHHYVKVIGVEIPHVNGILTFSSTFLLAIFSLQTKNGTIIHELKTIVS